MGPLLIRSIHDVKQSLQIIILYMGGRYHQKYYTCEMNGHKQKSFITNTNESSCLGMLEPNVVI